MVQGLHFRDAAMDPLPIFLLFWMLSPPFGRSLLHPRTLRGVGSGKIGREPPLHPPRSVPYYRAWPRFTLRRESESRCPPIVCCGCLLCVLPTRPSSQRCAKP
jgi:hypothetical protein